jgi:heme exporter protein CcmD
MSGDAHWGYIVSAYAATFVLVGGVAWRIVSEHKRLLADLARFSDQGDEA